MKFTIDGIEITALPGDTIMQAARREDIFIPGLCYGKNDEGTNCCRLCMVEVKEPSGKEKMVAACGFPVKEGISVLTDTESVARIRNTMLKLLYAQAVENPVIVSLMDRYHVEPDSRLPQKEGQCILCGLCVQACSKLGSSAISTVSRGITKAVDTPYGEPSEECIGCASCAELCPTENIAVQDTQDGRFMWNQQFDWAYCQICGKIVTTKKHYEASNPNESNVLCPSCRRKQITDVFAQTLGESENG